MLLLVGPNLVELGPIMAKKESRFQLDDPIAKFTSPRLNKNEIFNSGLSMDNLGLQSLSSEQLLSVSSYFGGSVTDNVFDGSLDSDGNFIVGGKTSSNDFPTMNAFDDTYNGVEDSYLTKFDDNFTILWSTYFGGSKSDVIESIAIDDSDNIIVTGRTQSSDFPTVNALYDTMNGSVDAFIAKFDRNGTLLWSTYLGGTSNEQETFVGVDSFGNILVAGVTLSSDFPLKNPYNSTFGGLSDVFVAKFTADGDMIWSTFHAGANGDYVHDITVDSRGNVIVVGVTLSSDFPVFRGISSSSRGGFDAFILKFAPDGDLIFSGVFGGSSNDYADSVTADEDDNLYVSGSTASTDFPASFSGISNVYGGGSLDGFVLYFNSRGALYWSTYLGGIDGDIASSVMFNSDGELLVVGRTKSANFPVLDGYDMFQEGMGNDDAFLVKISDQRLQWGTFFGGTKTDAAKIVLPTSSGELIVIGYSESDDLPVKNAFNSTSNGDRDLFMAKFFDSNDDFDHDGLTNYLEGRVGTSLNDPDTDSDGMPDGWEYQMGLDPLTPADDDDDFDSDGMPDGWEYQMRLNASNPSDAIEDADSDALINKQEFLLGLDARDADTDNDFLLDGDEVMNTFTNPLSNDTDADGILDGLEVLFYHTNPLKSDTDGDGISDSEEIFQGTNPLESANGSSNDANGDESQSSDNDSVTNQTNQGESDSQNGLMDTAAGLAPLALIGLVGLVAGLVIGRKIGNG